MEDSSDRCNWYGRQRGRRRRCFSARSRVTGLTENGPSRLSYPMRWRLLGVT